MNTLIMKLGATGDVVRTTPLLSRLDGHVAWVTASKNVPLLRGLREGMTSVSWEDRHLLPDVKYDLVINLEDTLDVAEFVKSVPYRQLFGAYADDQNVLRYTEESKRWFDLSLISRHGRAEADRLKFLNRHTYQELIFEGLGFSFKGDKYLLPAETQTPLSGDIAISPEAGPVWPMKNWAYYPELQRQLEERGFVVNVLPIRKTLLEHLADVRNHRCLVAGDSLPMHFALGSGVRTITLFTCTSPWEIHDYGILTKIISPLLGEFFYKRGMDRRATTAISVDEVLSAVLAQVQGSVRSAGKALA